MELAFPWPTSNGEWLAWSAAAVTALFGLIAMFLPATAFRLLFSRGGDDPSQTVSGMRGVLGGFHLGLGVSAILFAQPFIYLALGFAWVGAAFGQLLSNLTDRPGTVRGWLFLVVQLALATMPLAFVFGMVP